MRVNGCERIDPDRLARVRSTARPGPPSRSRRRVSRPDRRQGAVDLPVEQVPRVPVQGAQRWFGVVHRPSKVLDPARRGPVWSPARTLASMSSVIERNVALPTTAGGKETPLGAAEDEHPSPRPRLRPLRWSAVCVRPLGRPRLIRTSDMLAHRSPERPSVHRAPSLELSRRARAVLTAVGDDCAATN